MTIQELRTNYHRAICQQILRIIQKNNAPAYPNNADGTNRASREIALELINRIGFTPNNQQISAQTAGNLFEQLTKEFLENAFALIQHIRPGKWRYSLNTPISKFEQYQHLAQIDNAILQNRELAIVFGKDYVVSPDIVIAREPLTDDEINSQGKIIDSDEGLAEMTPLRQHTRNAPMAILHASISCKWTLRSDRAQNTRTEAYNLIRNRKGRLPHIMAVTAEPTPIRIASLALGTGDIDCVYHFALNELKNAVTNLKFDDQGEMLNMLIEGRRLRDISDLPFDLAI